MQGKSLQDDAVDTEKKRDEFRYPRHCLLNCSGDFLIKCTNKLNEINKRSAQEKSLDLLDPKCLVILNSVASSMLKLAPFDMQTMQSQGLHNYMTNIFPNTDWTLTNMRTPLTNFIRRLEKMMQRIHKYPKIYVSMDWSALAIILNGLYETVWKYPHVIVNMTNFKSLVTICQYLVIGQETAESTSGSFNKKSNLPSRDFCEVVFLLIALQVLAMGDAYTLENRVHLPETFSSSNIGGLQKEKTEVTLLNLVYPLLLLIGSGRKDVPKLRSSDIRFCLRLTLNVIKNGQPTTQQRGH